MIGCTYRHDFNTDITNYNDQTKAYGEIFLGFYFNMTVYSVQTCAAFKTNAKVIHIHVFYRMRLLIVEFLNSNCLLCYMYL